MALEKNNALKSIAVYCAQCGNLTSDSNTYCLQCTQGMQAATNQQYLQAQQNTAGGWYWYNGLSNTLSTTMLMTPITFPNIVAPKITRTGIDPDKLAKLKATEARKVLPRIPDYTEPITAYRCWQLNGKQIASLGSVGNGKWEPKKTEQARCIGGYDHVAPYKTCKCGFWAFKDLDRLVAATEEYVNAKLVGTVYLWGRIIETENGYRAEYAYPKELWSLDADNVIESLGRSYGVPIRTCAI